MAGKLDSTNHTAPGVTWSQPAMGRSGPFVSAITSAKTRGADAAAWRPLHESGVFRSFVTEEVPAFAA